MKKYIILALIISALTLSACSTSDTESESSSDTDTTIESVTETETETAPKPTNEEVISFSELTLSADPVYENGLLVLRFNSENVRYDADTSCSIGVIAADEAYSIKAKPDLEAYPDMLVSDGAYNGIALVPSEELETGSFKFSITIGEYIVSSFEMTIE